MLEITGHLDCPARYRRIVLQSAAIPSDHLTQRQGQLRLNHPGSPTVFIPAVLGGERCGWLRMIIVSPNMHRVHHSDWQPETDSNFSSIFSWWDRLGRSFRLRSDVRTLCYGLREFDDDQWQGLWGLLRTPLAALRDTRLGHQRMLASSPGGPTPADASSSALQQ
jgi:hypothetical protein